VRKKGFTLIELLVAVTIFAIMAASLYQTLYVGLKLWKRGAGASLENQRVRISLSQIAQDLRNAVPFVLLGGEWSERQISFPAIVSVEAADKNYSRLAVISYRFEEEGGQLVRTEIWPGASSSPEGNRKTVLAAQLGRVSFMFAERAPDSGGEYEWTETWLNSQNLPHAVKISLQPGREKVLSGYEKIVLLPMGQKEEKEDEPAAE
jgi:prepilin-type N-terminal cleavage/methylation domain-containing protein